MSMVQPTAIHDLIVVGGGLAGLTAANRAAELGKSVLVLEQGVEDRYLCNTRITGGVFHVCFRNTMDAPTELVETIGQVTGGTAKPELADALATDGRRAIRWLQSEGVRFIRAGPEDWKSWVLAPPGWSHDWRGRGGDVLLRTLAERLAQRGGTLRRGARALGLLMDGERCCGVEAHIGGSVQRLGSRSVLIADGGFQGNEELLRIHVTQEPGSIMQRNAGTARGDGLKMAIEVGANIIGARNIYGHLLAREALANERLSPFPFLDTIATAGIVVDSDGARFADEGLGGVYLTNILARRADPLSTWVIFDEAIWQGPATEFVVPPNPGLVTAGANVLSGSSVEEIAAAAGLSAERLSATVAAYNEALSHGRLESLDPPRRTSTHKAHPLRHPPFHAVQLCPGITYTMGGIDINEDGVVLRPGGSGIEGLYAAGSATGGLDGGPRAGYVSGLVKAATFAMRAAEHLARASP